MSSPSLPWQYGTGQQGWYTSGTLRKQFPDLTVQFILSLSTALVSACGTDSNTASHDNTDDTAAAVYLLMIAKTEKMRLLFCSEQASPSSPVNEGNDIAASHTSCTIVCPCFSFPSHYISTSPSVGLEFGCQLEGGDFDGSSSTELNESTEPQENPTFLG